MGFFGDSIYSSADGSVFVGTDGGLGWVLQVLVEMKELDGRLRLIR